MLSRIKAFLDDRTGLPGMLRGVLDAPLAGGARWRYVFGTTLVFLFALEFSTGLALGTVYAPSTQTAWASVFFIQYHFHWGALVRGVHYWAAQSMVILIGLQLGIVLVTGAYQKPREVNWWATLALLAIALAFTHTGSLLPWDQAAYWTTRVEAGITGTTPVVGAAAQRFMQGGRDLGTLSLTRLYAAHVGLLPLLGLGLLLAYVALSRRHRIVPPGVADEALAADASKADVDALRSSGVRVDRYWPDQAARDAVVCLFLCIVVFLLARRAGAPLEAPADPQGNYPARPEWYLLGLFKLRHAFEGKTEIIATLVIPGIVTTFFVALPFLDRAQTQRVRDRIPWVAMGLALMALIGGYTGYALLADARDPALREGRRHVEEQARRAIQLATAGIPPEGPLEMVRNDPRVRPSELYQQHCAGCHAPATVPAFDPQGARTRARGPVLEGFGSRAWAMAVMNNPDADVLFHRTGIQDMGTQAARLGDAQRAVAEYLYSQSIEAGDPPADANLVREGDTVFHTKCTACHQGAGDLSGADAADRDGPDLSGWGSRAWIRAQIEQPAAPTRYGERNRMPQFGDRLQGRELEWVIDYVRGLRNRTAPSVAVPPPSH